MSEENENDMWPKPLTVDIVKQLAGNYHTRNRRFDYPLAVRVRNRGLYGIVTSIKVTSLGVTLLEVSVLTSKRSPKLDVSTYSSNNNNWLTKMTDSVRTSTNMHMSYEGVFNTNPNPDDVIGLYEINELDYYDSVLDIIGIDCE